MNVHNYLLCQHVWVPLKLLMQLNHQSTLRGGEISAERCGFTTQTAPLFFLSRGNIMTLKWIHSAKWINQKQCTMAALNIVIIAPGQERWMVHFERRKHRIGFKKTKMLQRYGRQCNEIKNQVVTALRVKPNLEPIFFFFLAANKPNVHVFVCTVLVECLCDTPKRPADGHIELIRNSKIQWGRNCRVKLCCQAERELNLSASYIFTCVLYIPT